MARLVSALLSLPALSLPALVLGAVGCVTTGQAWVQQPENSLSAAGSPELARGAEAELAPLSVAQAANTHDASVAADAPRPRLSQVVSLGESAGSDAPRAEASPSPHASAPSVVVNIVNHAAPPAYGYGYSAPYPVGASRLRAHRPSRVGPSSPSPPPVTPAVGEDWKAPASYGPIFPYRTGPASPWQRPR